jgi:A/G-specific adenine glycosylase
MTEVPGTAWTADQDSTADGAPLAATWKRVAGKVVHVFTHFRLELTVYRADFGARQKAPGGMWWASPDALPGEALPSVMKKAIEAAIPGATRKRAA